MEYSPSLKLALDKNTLDLETYLPSWIINFNPLKKPKQ